MRKLILASSQSPGDIVMLTACVRDLHAAYPSQFLTDIRTPCPALWEHNPHITHISDDDVEAKRIDMHYPLIHQSNQRPYHQVHGYQRYLSRVLDLRIEPTSHTGDIHLSQGERMGWPSDLFEDDGRPYWVVVSGGKHDFTAKWPDPFILQNVLNHTGHAVRWVQVGEEGHHHPQLYVSVDLRGRTTLRQLVHLVHHAAGVLCPVTLAMHLAAAVPTRRDRPGRRACIVLAGGREPPHWECYPWHQYHHTIGMLPCCALGGCWRDRCEKVGDGDQKDEKGLCERPMMSVRGYHVPECQTMMPTMTIAGQVLQYQGMITGRSIG